MSNSSSTNNTNKWFKFYSHGTKMHLQVLNIMVIMKITLFLLVVKNPSACKALKSSHCSKKKMIDFYLGDCPNLFDVAQT